MHRHVKTILIGILLSVFCLSGCVTPVLVDYDREAAAGFGAYKYFTLETTETQENPKDLVFSPIAKRRFKLAIETKLKERGYIEDASKADFIVRFQGTKKTINELDFNYPIYSSRFYCYDGFYPQVGFFPPPQLNQYDEGSFVIDIINTQSEELVWRGTYTKRLGRKPHTDEEIRTIIDRILDQFPPEERVD